MRETAMSFTNGIIRTTIGAVGAALLFGTLTTVSVWANDSGDNAVERAKNFCSDANTLVRAGDNQALYTASVLLNAAKYVDDVKAGFEAVEIAKIEVAETKRFDGKSLTRSFEAVRVTFSDKSVRYYVPGPLGAEFDDVDELNSPTRSARLIEATKHETDMREYYRRSLERRVREERETFVKLWRSASKAKNSGDAQLDFNLTIRDILATAPIFPDQNKHPDDLLRRLYDACLPRGVEAASAEAEEMEKIWKAAEASKTQAEATK